MKIYVASSWRNALQSSIVAVLRELGHDVYDFKNPPNGSGFGWNQVNPDWKLADGAKGFVDADTYRKMLAHPFAEAGYASDIEAVKAADAVVYVLPCGRSASWEFGYIMGCGKPGYVVWFDLHEPELMFREAIILGSMEELRATFVQPGIVEKNCKACAYCFVEPDDDFVCGHPDAGPVGTYVKRAAAEGGHCGLTRLKFKQHPLRQPNGDLGGVGVR